MIFIASVILMYLYCKEHKCEALTLTKFNIILIISFIISISVDILLMPSLLQYIDCNLRIDIICGLVCEYIVVYFITKPIIKKAAFLYKGFC